MKANMLTAAGICLASLVCSGCTSEPDRPTVYPVTGVVTYEGKAVEGANVLFVPDDKALQPASAITDAEGKYALTTFEQGDGALPGSYKIKVLKFNGQPAAAGNNDQRFMSYEEEQKAYAESSGKPTPPAKNQLPKKYEFEDRSGLTHTVPTAPSTYDIKLE